MDCWWLAEVRQSLSHHDEVHHWITKKVRYSTVQGLLRLQSMNYELFKSSLPVIRNPPKSPNFLNVGGFFYTFMMVQEVMFYHGYHGKTATQRGRSFSIGNKQIKAPKQTSGSSMAFSKTRWFQRFFLIFDILCPAKLGFHDPILTEKCCSKNGLKIQRLARWWFQIFVIFTPKNPKNMPPT